MSVAMQVVQIIFYCVGILFMLTFMFIGIWSFILFIKMYKNQRINNYLLEKINKTLSSITDDNFSKKTSTSDSFIDDLFDNSSDDIHDVEDTSEK